MKGSREALPVPILKGAAGSSHSLHYTSPCGHPTPCGCATAAQQVGRDNVCCMDCPFEECVYVVSDKNFATPAQQSALVRSQMREERLSRVVGLREQGYSVTEIMRVLHCSRRNVFRVLREARLARTPYEGLQR